MKNFLLRLLPENKASGDTQRSTIDWILLLAIIPVCLAGLFTMNSFLGESIFFQKQLLWIAFGTILFFSLSFIDFRFLKSTRVIVVLFAFACVLLLSLFMAGKMVKGSQSWFDFGFFSFQPSDPIKIIVILILAKYFSRRHIEIANIRHIFISGFYAFVIFALILLEPDFGSAMTIFLLWLGMVLISGISKRHLLLVGLVGILSFGVLWNYGFKDYQKQRVKNFLSPLNDVRGTGYNAYQSTIAVGSGEVWGKGVGYGTQSRLKFLPEYQTDFIFAAFAEEWGFVGVVLLFGLYALIIWRILVNALYGATNFEILFGAGLAIYFMAHFCINVGMNIGLLPVTGLVMPFMSYGGSHILTEFSALGILMGMRRYRRAAHKDLMKNEFFGV